MAFRAARLLVLAIASVCAAQVTASCRAEAESPAPASLTRAASDDEFEIYRHRSEDLLRKTEDSLKSELRSLDLSEWSSEPPEGGKRFEWENHAVDWFAGSEARTLADNLLSYQLPCGGWSKNIDFARHARRPGERPYRSWGPVGTFDNQATWKHLRFIARVHRATGQARYQGAFLRGLRYVFDAQYPTGGWPQVYPLIGGYHDQITLNDGALPGIVGLLCDVAFARPGLEFVPEEERSRAQQALDRALDCVLKCQIVVEGERTAWCQQYDAATFEPTAARSYEVVALASQESAWLLGALMDLPEPTPETIRAVRSGMKWLEARAIEGLRWQWTDDGPMAVPDPQAPPIWARFYRIGDNRPVFCDRSGNVYDDVNLVPKERRRFYAWYVSFQFADVLAKYPSWEDAHPENPAGGGERH